MTQCNATAELMGADMAIIPGITLRCELEAGHDIDSREHPFGGLIHEVDYPEAMREWSERTGRWAYEDAWRIVPGTDHAFTFRWHDVTTDELAEVLDPDESFDLEVDIADEAVLEQQQNAGIANGTVGPGQERDCPRLEHGCAWGLRQSECAACHTERGDV